MAYRRLKHSWTDSETPDSVPDSRIKDIWASRMDGVFEEEPTVRKKKTVCIIGDGEREFEGEDAAEQWLGGFTQEQYIQQPEPDRSWPSSEYKIETYPGWRAGRNSIW